MAGYHGYSMSNNAVAAYSQGEQPYSKWTKSDILAEIPSELKDVAKQLTVAELKALFLHRTSWHHTSSHFNRTDFYSVDSDGITAEQITAIIADRKPAEKKETVLVKAKVHYLTWEGTRKHPKAVEHIGYAVLNDKWAFTLDGKKSRSANGFRIIETYVKAPKGTAEIFRKIQKGM